MTDLSGAIELRHGLATINAARTVWEMGRLSDLEGGVCTADSALSMMPELRDPIEELAERYHRYPDANRARLVIRLADGRSGSAGESVTRVQFYRYSVPKPVLQFEVRGRDGEFLGFSDFGWDGHRHLGEFDGKVKYLKYLREGETPSACVFREKRREDAMRGEYFGMSRFVWELVMPRSARRTMERLRYDLEQSRRLTSSVAPPDSAGRPPPTARMLPLHRIKFATVGDGLTRTVQNRHGPTGRGSADTVRG